jgi:transcriptional regulator with XRE-family HTH domain
MQLMICHLKKGNKMNYKEKRKKLKLTQGAVALKLGISLVAWQLIERGITKTPRRETQERIDLLFKGE